MHLVTSRSYFKLEILLNRMKKHKYLSSQVMLYEFHQNEKKLYIYITKYMFLKNMM